MRYFFLLLLALATLPSQAQFLVSGKLLDEHQQPVPFASVALADGRSGTASNEVGEFSLRLAALPQDLIVLSIGYERATVHIEKAGVLASPIILKASQVQLPEVTVRAADEAEELVRRCYAKLVRHQNDVQYGRAFYRQKTRQNGRYREFFDAFYDVKLTPRLMPSWVLGEARYAVTLGGLSFSNFSSVTRSLPVFAVNDGQPHKITLPLSADAPANFRFVLRQTLRENGHELAVVGFEPRPGVLTGPRGSLYIDPRTAALFRIEQALPADQMLNISETADIHIEKLSQQMTIDFVAQNDSLTRLASTRSTATVSLLVRGFSDETVATSHFFFYEYGPPTPGQRYPATDAKAVDLTPIRKRRYHPEFWRDNAVIKASPVEETIIRDFEGSKFFGQL